MALIKREVSGSAEDLKLVSDGRNAPTTPGGGTKRRPFTGSNDTRAAGNPAPNKRLREARGYIDQGAVNRDISDNHGAQFVNQDVKPINRQINVANEDVTRGFRGRND
jgi:hypothetical protein